MSSSTTTHPLDRLASRGWSGGLARLALGAIVLTVIFSLTGREAVTALLHVEHLPLFALGCALAATQRIIRIRKWSWIVTHTELLQRPLSYLLRIQFVGLMANLLIPISELLKIWAVSRAKTDAYTATATIAVDITLLSAAVGVLGGLGGLFLTLTGGAWWLPLPGACLTLAAVVVIAALRLRIAPTVPFTTRASLLSVLEALCILGVYAAALTTLQVPLSLTLLLALFPLLYLSHLVMLTPSGLGLREALFALVFAGISDTPAETAVTVGLMVSVIQLAVTLGGGGIALLIPGASLRASSAHEHTTHAE